MKQVVGGALFRKDELLVVKRTPDRILGPNVWEIPGGKVEPGENNEEALEREFMEETKIKIRVIKKYHTFHYKYDEKDAEENDFIVEAENFNVTIDPKEHTEFRWVTKGQLSNLNISPDMRKSIEKAFDLIKN